MKHGWNVKKLENLCVVFADGDWIESKDQSNEGVRLIQTGNIGKGFFKNKSEKARYISDETFKKLKCTEIYEDDCLVSRLPDPVGRACLIPSMGEKMITAVDCTIMRFKKQEISSLWFVFYSLSKAYQEQINMQVSGATRQRISRKNLSQITIPLPSLPEQQRIVAILEEAFGAINKAKENAEQNFKNAQELFESYLQSVFETKGEGWEEKKLGEVCELINRGISPKYIEKNGIVVLNQKCIREHKINFELSRLHDSFSKKVSIEKIVRKGDVLVNSTGTGTLGRVAQVRDELQDVTVDSHITIVRPMENMFFIPFFGWALIFIEDEISKKGDGCGGQIELARNTLKNDFKICYPKSLTEQQTIVTKLDALSEQTKKLERIYEQKLADLEELKKSILHKAFNGEL